MEGVAYGDLVETGEQAAPPITAEAEAERPTRAPRKVVKKASAAADADTDVVDDDELDLGDPADELDPVTPRRPT